LDSNQVELAMQYFDSSGMFILVPLLEGSLKNFGKDITKAYKNITLLKSNWQEIEIKPLKDELAYCQGRSKQVAEDSTGKSQYIFGNISVLVQYQNNKWKF
jgi:hypothetical protein